MRLTHTKPFFKRFDSNTFANYCFKTNLILVSTNFSNVIESVGHSSLFPGVILLVSILAFFSALNVSFQQVCLCGFQNHKSRSFHICRGILQRSFSVLLFLCFSLFMNALPTSMNFPPIAALFGLTTCPSGPPSALYLLLPRSHKKPW